MEGVSLGGAQRERAVRYYVLYFHLPSSVRLQTFGLSGPSPFRLASVCITRHARGYENSKKKGPLSYEQDGLSVEVYFFSFSVPAEDDAGWIWMSAPFLVDAALHMSVSAGCRTGPELRHVAAGSLLICLCTRAESMLNLGSLDACLCLFSFSILLAILALRRRQLPLSAVVALSLSLSLVVCLVSPL